MPLRRNIRVVIELSYAPSSTPLRACGCSFCRATGWQTVVDPAGTLKMWAQDWSDILRYRFGTGAVEFLACKRCSVYVAAISQTPAGVKAVANVEDSLADRALFTAEPTLKTFDGESADQRIARHTATWMPAILHESDVLSRVGKISAPAISSHLSSPRVPNPAPQLSSICRHDGDAGQESGDVG